MIFEYLIKQKIDIDFNKLYQEQLKLSYNIAVDDDSFQEISGQYLYWLEYEKE